MQWRSAIGNFAIRFTGSSARSSSMSSSTVSFSRVQYFFLGLVLATLSFQLLLHTQGHGLEFTCTQQRPFRCTAATQVLESTFKIDVLQLVWQPDTWDPGPRFIVSQQKTYNLDQDELNSRLTPAHTWNTRIQKNKLAHINFGNRGQRGKGITCMYWNKGPSMLNNKQMDIETIIADHHPHVLGLGEANHRHDQDIEAVQIPGYNLHLDSGVDNMDVGGMARVAVYTHSSLRVNRRYDLEDDKIPAVWLECGLPRQKGILICMGYRQWRLLGQEDNSSASTAEQFSRWSTFLDKWESAIEEGKEVIVMLDANLDFLTWRNCEHLPPYHSSNRLKSLIDSLFDRIIPL
jgi:hypothetical protein